MADLNNEILKGQIQINRIINTLIKSELIPAMSDNYREIRLLLLEAENITSARQLQRINTAVKNIINESMIASWETVTEQMEQAALIQANTMTQVIAGAVGADIIEKTNIADYIQRSIMSLDGNNPAVGTWAEFVKNNINGQAEVINNQIKAAYVNSETIRQTIKRVKQANEGILKNRAEALARTGVNHYATQARLAVASDNSDIVEREKPVVTFDSRLSVTCSSIGAKYGVKGWPVGESPVGYPPYHYNCRTVIGFIIDGFEDQTEGRDVNEWLKQQPDDFQNEILGKSRADAFRKGTPLNKFTDAVGQPLTVEELDKRDIIK